ncbi:uncharacterized protein HNR42_003367 [Deinobacterium chartae]|uniref:HD domain-containing protein n=1 Tax=Deinobacterium chartae TaxID=521158 RepID=A0A841I2J6_9DEIO|nr:hypothetical protein [Deinobacterium chartae]MBB6099907.1 uncharacterized protein [Deinobacterium chartae]
MFDFDALRARLIQEFPLGEASIHGPDHWDRVRLIGERLAVRSGADLEVVRLFSVFHDCLRQTDSWDPGHGSRGARRARELNGELFALSEARLRLLTYACDHHTDGEISDDPTIGTCWDADRLELPRVGIVPDPRLLSTEAARDPDTIRWAILLPRPQRP